MVETVSQIISSTVAPIVLISAIGLLMLMEQNRYARIKDRAFNYINRRNDLRVQIKIITEHSEDDDTKKQISEKRKANLNQQLRHCEVILTSEMREALLIKNAMFSGLIAIAMVSLTSLLLLFSSSSTDTSDLLSSLTLTIFAIGLLSLLLSVFFMALDLWVSFSTIREELISEDVVISHQRTKQHSELL